MTKEQVDLFTKYTELKQTIKEATKELDAIKDEVKELVPEEGIDLGMATIDWSKGKPRWQYSQKVGEMELNVKEAMQEERQTGLAEKVYGEPFLVCNFK